VEGAFSASEALHNDFGVAVDKYTHVSWVGFEAK
jgi:hypothetical protein